jgi:hypothetical protein
LARLNVLTSTLRLICQLAGLLATGPLTFFLLARLLAGLLCRFFSGCLDLRRLITYHPCRALGLICPSGGNGRKGKNKYGNDRN